MKLLLALLMVAVLTLAIASADEEHLDRYRFTAQHMSSIGHPQVLLGALCQIPTLNQAQSDFNKALGIEETYTVANATSIDYAVNNIIMKQGTPGVLSVCSARQQFAFALGPSYPYCINSFYLIGQGNTINNAIYYTHLYRHLEFICSAAFQVYTNNLACIKLYKNNDQYTKCFTDYNNNINNDPRNFCDYTATLTQCVQAVYANCPRQVSWSQCELERVGFAQDCPNIVCSF